MSNLFPARAGNGVDGLLGNKEEKPIRSRRLKTRLTDRPLCATSTCQLSTHSYESLALIYQDVGMVLEGPGRCALSAADMTPLYMELSFHTAVANRSHQTTPDHTTLHYITTS